MTATLPKALTIAIATAVVMLVSAPPTIGAGQTCRVRNVTQDESASSLARVVDRARDGDQLVVRGSCEGGTVIDVDLSVRGGSAPAVLDGHGRQRVLDIAPGSRVTLRGLVVRGGIALRGGGVRNLGKLTILDSTLQGNIGSSPSAAEPYGTGGAIFNRGDLLLISVTLTDNAAGDGAALYNARGAAATLRDVTISGGFAERGGSGGGIANGGRLLLVGSRVIGNRAEQGGGGISTWGTLRVRRSLLRDNEVTMCCDGGAISNGGRATIRSSVVQHNTAEETGGGLSNYGTMRVVDTAIRGNTSRHEGGGVVNGKSLRVTRSRIQGNRSARGGGIANDGSLTLEQVVIVDNEAQVTGGGLSNRNGSVRLVGSAVRANGAIAGAGISNAAQATLSLRRSRVVRNEAEALAGGILNDDGTVTLDEASSVTANVPDQCAGTPAC